MRKADNWGQVFELRASSYMSSVIIWLTNLEDWSGGTLTSSTSRGERSPWMPIQLRLFAYFSDALFSETERHRTDSNTLFKSRRTEIANPCKVYWCSKICHRASTWSVQSWLGWKTAGFSRTYLLWTLDDRERIMSASILDTTIFYGFRTMTYHLACRLMQPSTNTDSLDSSGLPRLIPGVC